MSVSLFWKRLLVLHDFYFYKYRCSIPFKCKVVSFNVCYSVVCIYTLPENNGGDLILDH